MQAGKAGEAGEGVGVPCPGMGRYTMRVQEAELSSNTSSLSLWQPALKVQHWKQDVFHSLPVHMPYAGVTPFQSCTSFLHPSCLQSIPSGELALTSPYRAHRSRVGVLSGLSSLC